MWKRPTKKWTLNEAVNLPFMKVNHMKVQERAELAAYLQDQINKRAMTYARAGAYKHPFAYQKFRDDWQALNEATNEYVDFDADIITSSKDPKTGRIMHELGPEYAQLNNAAPKLLSYIIQAQKFFQAKSSTITGWKEIIRNESAKLFGTTTYTRKSDGKQITRLNYLMTEEERATFWKLYDELRKSGKIAIYDSESMRVTGYLRIWRENVRNKAWDFSDLTGMMNDVLDKMRERGVPVRDLPEQVSVEDGNPSKPNVGDTANLTADDWAAMEWLNFDWDG